MKRSILLLAVFAFTVSLTVSCKKSGSSSKSKTELATQSSWKYDNAAIDADDNGTGDTPVPGGVIQSCQTDNVLTLNADGSGMVDEGATKCNAGDPQTSNFTWSFTNNETVINFNSPVFAGVGGDFKIITLTETQLALSKQVTLAPLPTTTVIVTFKH